MNILKAGALSGAVLLLAAGCSGSRDTELTLEKGQPLIRVVCDVTIQDRAYDTGIAVVAAPTTKSHEFLVSDRSQIRARLEALGVGTKSQPCTRLSIDGAER